MRILRMALMTAAMCCAMAAKAQETIPTGTIIPVALSATISSTKMAAGASVSAKVMQDVPLPNDKRIRTGATVTGHVVAVRKQGSAGGVSITLTFDRVMTSKDSKNGLPVVTDLRAMASFTEVNEAMIPQFGMGEGDTWNARTTEQIGGEQVYWGGGPVVGRFGPVGKPLEGADSGVLVHVTDAPGGMCRGEMDDIHAVQAMWVFSSDACGVYGLSGLSIAHAGRDAPVGVIELRSEDGEVKIHSGTGMLLRVTAQ